MSNLLYTFLLIVYDKLLYVVSFFHTKAKDRIQNQFNFREAISQRDYTKKLIWFHCASLGEFEQGRPVIEAFKRVNPDWQLLLTFYSPSGYNVRKNYNGADIICYLPADIPQNVTEFLTAFRPDEAVFVKYEFWHNYIKKLHEWSIPIISISTILRSNQYFFKWYGGFGRRTLERINHFFVQNVETKQLLSAIGIQQVTLAGDTRFDRVWQTAQDVKEIPAAASFKNGQDMLVAGSVWAEDMAVLIPVINQLKLKCIIAPHEIEAQEIKKWQAQINKKSICYSEIDANKDLSQYEVLFIDNVGMLSALYQYADFAFIGGAYGAGLHNILEAATFGVPIFFGNQYYAKFQEAEDLLVLKSAHAVADSEELLKNLRNHLQDELLRKSIAKQNKAYIEAHTGATTLIINYLLRK